MEMSLLLGFAAMAAVIELSPGPNFLLILRSVPAFRKKGALANCTGFSTSYLLHGALAIYGVSALIAAKPIILVLIQVTGACYLLYLGVKALSPSRQPEKLPKSPVPTVDILLLKTADCMREKPANPGNDSALVTSISTDEHNRNPHIDIVLDNEIPQTRIRGLFGCYTQGLLISAFNPKITLFYVAAFPQFIMAGRNAVSHSFFLVFVHIAICIIWTTLVALVLEYVLQKNSGGDVVGKLNRVSGIALIGLSMTFFTSAAQAI